MGKKIIGHKHTKTNCMYPTPPDEIVKECCRFLIAND